MISQFLIKGEDNEVYGPVGLEELQVWLGEKRVGPGTMVKLVGSEGEWELWQRFPQLVKLERERLGGELVPAAYSSRLAAFIVDSFVLTMISVLLALLSASLLPAAFQINLGAMVDALQEGNNLSGVEMQFLLLVMMIRLFYFTYFHGRDGQTPGKKFFKIRVVTMQGAPPDYFKAFLRAIGSLISEAPYFLGYLIIFFMPQRRAFHDLVVGTTVVKVDGGGKLRS